MEIEGESRLASATPYPEAASQLLSADRRAYYAAKRAMDLIIASLLLLLLLPLIVLVGIAIFIYSPGPIFFVQERVGAKRYSKGRFITWEPTTFRCFKFRTMKLHADPAIHQAYIKALIENNQSEMDAVQNVATRPRGSVSQQNLTAAQNDPARPRKLIDDARVIAPGRLLRKFSIDEIPQILNVIHGDMSMVGPRPAIPYEVQLYKPWHMLRLQAQPGITGLQQITRRCTAEFDEQVRLDIDYIKHQSLWLDLKIAVKTPMAILKATGAC